MPTNHLEFLKQALIINHFDISLAIQEQFLHYLNLMRHWNRVYNLTAIIDPDEMIMLHILDSLSISAYLQGTRIIDVGTGAGLPGIPLALIYPDKQFTLLDSNNKKTRFLTQVMIDLKLKNVEIIHARCEDFQSEHPFNSIVSRAFASLEVMLATTQHLSGKQSLFLAMKGSYPEQELLTLPEKFKIDAVHKLIINGLDAERHLVCLKKEGSWEK
jgi:16S rRNA (guanine(527)-N(7))-methyltransferase RsmG